MPGEGIPAIRWATYPGETAKGKKFAHVAPVIEGKLMPGHIGSVRCDCNPKVDRSTEYIIVIHEVIH